MNTRISHQNRSRNSSSVIPEEDRLLYQNKVNNIKMTTRQGRILCFKYSLYGFSLLFMMVGFGLLALGVWLKVDYRFRDFLSEEYREVVKERWWNASTLYVSAYLIIVIGAVMIVVSFFGCCGAIHENQCILMTYFVFLLLLLICTLGVGIFLITRRDMIENEVGDALTYMTQNYYQGAGIVPETMDAIQETFRCCGNAGCGDYRELKIDIPRSCDLRCDGCRFRVYKALRIGYTIVSIIFLIVLVVQLFALSMSMLLCCWIRGMAKEMQYRYYLPATNGAHEMQRNTPLTTNHKLTNAPPKVKVRQMDSSYDKLGTHAAYTNRPVPQQITTRNIQQEEYGHPPPQYSTHDSRTH